MRRLVYILALIVCTLNVSAQTGEDPELDSVITLYHQLSDDDTAKVTQCFKVARTHFNVDSTIMWSNRLIDIATRTNRRDYVAEAYGFLSWAYTCHTQYDTSIVFNNLSVAICDSMGILDLKAWNYYHLGTVYYMKSNYAFSYDYYFKALGVYTQLNNSEGCAKCYRQIADNYICQNKFDEVEGFIQKALECDSANNDLYGIAEDYRNLAKLHYAHFTEQFVDPDTSLIGLAKQNIMKALSVNCDAKSVRIYCLRQLCEIYYLEFHYLNLSSDHKLLLLDSMDVSRKEMIDLSKQFGSTRCTVGNYSINTLYNIARRNFPVAKIYLDSLKAFVNENDIRDYVSVTEWDAMQYFLATGDYKSAYESSLRFFGARLSEANIALAVKSAQDYDQLLFQEQQRQEVYKQERHKLLLRVSLSALVAVLLFVAWEYFRSQNHSQQLDEKNRVLRGKNKQITDSINYASLIQKAVLPKDDNMTALFKDYFLIFRPLHTVAGDFYWTRKIGDYTLLVCADCTGHGVPGAFLSMLGISLLNEICPLVVNNGGTPSEILDLLRVKLKAALGQEKQPYDYVGMRSNMDGMDLALVMMDSAKKVMYYSGAYRPLWMVRDGQITKIKPDKMPIGLYLGDEVPFTTHKIDILQGDMFYLFSDGIPDQFGYTFDDKKEYHQFSLRRLEKILIDNSQMDMETQKAAIENAIDSWKNGYQQLDDNILIGFRV